MSRKTIYTILIAILIIIFGALAVGYFYVRSEIKTAQITGEPVKTPGGFFGSLYSLFNGDNPIENTTSVTGPITATTTITSDTGAVVSIPRLREISTDPVAGAIFMVRNIASTTIRNGKSIQILIPETFIRFVERATGHIFETKPDNLATVEIANTTIAKIYEAYFTNGGNSVIYRFLNKGDSTIETYYANLNLIKASTSTLATSSVLYSLSGAYFPENIPQIAISPARTAIFYYGNNGSGAIGYSASTNNSGQKQIFSSPLSQWLVDWPTTSTISLNSKPSTNANGYLFFLNSSSGSQTRVLSDIPGLTSSVSPDASLVLFSGATGNSFYLNLYNLKTGVSTVPKLNTLPEKCVWSHKTIGVVYCGVPTFITAADYPDAWYQGRISFSDDIWKINLLTNEATALGSPAALARETMDITNLTLDPSENYLMFINKKDLSLWNFLINPPPAPVFPVATSTAATSTATSS